LNVRNGEANQVLKILRVALATLLLAASAVVAQEFPNRPVRIIVPFSPGGPADFLPRVIGAKLSQLWGQPVVVENRTGAAGNIGMSMGAKATADGYTLTSAPGGNLAVNPHMYPNLGYDVFKDFTPITLMATVQNVLVVNPSIPANTVPELIALAKAQPGKLTFGSGGVGSYNHLGGELLKAMAQIDLLHVPYKGIGDAISAMLGGQISMGFVQVSSVKQYIDAGRLRALAVASPQRNPVLPNVPTVNEAGTFNGFEAVSWYALVGPAGIPRALVQRIQSDVAQVVQMPDVREKLVSAGADPGGGPPEQLRAHMRIEYDRYGPLIRKLGIKAE
jgi:tripartite-type tricarboxylate transporter receptor subunit TctC